MYVYKGNEVWIMVLSDILDKYIFVKQCIDKIILQNHKKAEDIVKCFPLFYFIIIVRHRGFEPRTT